MQRSVSINRTKKGKETADVVAVEVKEHLKTLVEAQATQKDLKAAQEKKEAKLMEHKNKLLDKFIEMFGMTAEPVKPCAPADAARGNEATYDGS
ncbi:hypothetical protein E2562_020163 [Oryza meyeriana var. granulata]|uniref:Uncharacterized protein n=1 Tax=Oryza meyeriana var. granulata TaxID=110450 RepID=A0A6G1BKS6_9ORYZ|nr:hypothetical protein E2562_020163 [Oryza meyeriana var. granulata]